MVNRISLIKGLRSKFFVWTLEFNMKHQKKAAWCIGWNIVNIAVKIMTIVLLLLSDKKKSSTFISEI